MPILKAIGLGILILVLKFLVPAIFTELEATIIAGLSGARTSFVIAESAIATTGGASPSFVPLFHPPSATPPFPLPTAPTYNP